MHSNFQWTYTKQQNKDLIQIQINYKRFFDQNENIKDSKRNEQKNTKLNVKDTIKLSLKVGSDTNLLICHPKTSCLCYFCSINEDCLGEEWNS